MKPSRMIMGLLLTVSLVFAAGVSFADEATTDVLSQKLDQVLSNQEKIMSDLQNIKSELEVVKVRTTQ